MTLIEIPKLKADEPAQRHGRIVWEITGNILLSVFFLQFVVINMNAFQKTFQISTLLLIAKVSTDVVFYLIRRMPKEVSMSLYDWLVGLAGTFLAVFFRPEPYGQDLPLGQCLQVVGMLLQIASMLSLNRSIGIVAANRGIKTGGMYRFVRHPLYLSYVIAFAGYVMNHVSVYNLSIYTALILLYVLRLLAEERFLMRAPDYQEFARRTRWRIIPFVF